MNFVDDGLVGKKGSEHEKENNELTVPGVEPGIS